ncbi:MAG: TIGR02444 family protein [Devosia sp.]|nr:TIGR02444 family protein [Devosia sp.]
MTRLDLDGPLWRFAIRLYDEEGVSPACLRLQNEGGVDVLLLLAGLYAEIALAAPLAETEYLRLSRNMAEWRDEAIQPLRALRIWLKPSQAGVPDDVREKMRNRVKALELDAERIQLARIADWLADNRDTTSRGGPLQLAWLVQEKARSEDLAAAFELVRTRAAGMERPC